MTPSPVASQDLALIKYEIMPLIVHQRTRIVFINHAAYDVLQFDTERFDFVGSDVFELFHPTDREAARKLAEDTLRDKLTTRNILRRFIDGKGRLIQVTLSAMAVTWDGQPAVAECFVAHDAVDFASASTSDPLSALTDRERDLTRLLVMGLTLAQAARALRISLNTAQTHAKSVYRKLKVGSRSELVREVRERGWG